MRRWVTMGCLTGLAWSAAGCGSADAGQLRRQVSTLEQELATLQSAQDRLEDEMAALRAARISNGSKNPDATSKEGAGEAAAAPLLEVVKLSPPTEKDAPGASGSADAVGKAPPTAAPSTPRSAGKSVPAAGTAAEGAPGDGPLRPVIRGSGDKVEGKNFEQPTGALVPSQKCDQPHALRQDPVPARRT